MRPKGTLRVGFMCAGVIASLLLLSASLSADACQGDHGIYTNILCVGDHMTGEGAYIISPDGYWRLYISGGTLSPVYDVYGDDSWEWTLVNEQPDNVAYGVILETGLNPSLDVYDHDYNVFWVGQDADLGESNTDYIRMDDNGCVADY